MSLLRAVRSIFQRLKKSSESSGRLAADFREGIPWEKSAEEIAAFIKSRNAFTYFCGFKMWVRACEVHPQRDPGASPGEVLSAVDLRNPLVQTGTQWVRLTDYTVEIAGETSRDLAEFIRITRLAPPYRFTLIPFARNQDSNLWELSVGRWRNKGIDPTPVVATPDREPVRLEGTFYEQNRRFIRFLARKLDLKPGMKILDVGCGDGWACRLFYELGLDVTGIDILPWSIAAAQSALPRGHFHVCDIYDLVNPAKIPGPFDFILCRDLGIAQKIVDWNEPTWLSVGESLSQRLTPEGSLYWIQISNGTNQITPDGFTNASLDVLRRYFERSCQVVEYHHYGYMSFLCAKRPSSSPLAARVESFDLQHFRASAQAFLANPDESSHRAFVKAMYSRVAKALLVPDPAKQRGLFILGNGATASVARNVIRRLGLNLAADASSAGVILRLAGPISAENVIEAPCDESHEAAPEDFYLVSGDQDAYFDQYWIDRLG